MLFFRYFPPKNSSIEQLFNDFLKKTSEKIAIPYKHFLKKDKSIIENIFLVIECQGVPISLITLHLPLLKQLLVIGLQA